MADPILQYRGDVVIMVDWTSTTGVGTTWTNYCGANSCSLTVTNEVQETKVGDCDDWTKPIVVKRAYGAQSWAISMNAFMTKQTRDKLLLAVSNQKLLPIRVHLVGAAVGEVQYIDGAILLPTMVLDGMANQDGQPLNQNFEGTFNGKPALTVRAT